MEAERGAGIGSFPQPVLMREAPLCGPTVPFMLKDQMYSYVLCCTKRNSTKDPYI